MSKPKKPTGTIGGFVIGPSGMRFEAVRLPTSKPEIELYIVQRAVREAGRRGLALWDLVGAPKQNAEDDFDFELSTVRGTEYLDLAEIVPENQMRAGYAGLPYTNPLGHLAGTGIEIVRAKDAHYRSINRRAIHLLVYATDRRVALHPPIRELIGRELTRTPPEFASVVYYAPVDNEVGELVSLHPHTERHPGFVDMSDDQLRSMIVGTPQVASQPPVEEPGGR